MVHTLSNQLFQELLYSFWCPHPQCLVQGYFSPDTNVHTLTHTPSHSHTQLFEHVHPEAVIILHSLPSHEHFSPHPHDEDALFLRCLKSSSWPHPCHTHFLESPNTIKGEPAAGMCVRVCVWMGGSVIHERAQVWANIERRVTKLCNLCT